MTTPRAPTAANEPELAALLRRIRDAPSVFYQKRLSTVGPTAIGSDPETALAQLPLTRRDDLLRDQLAHLPHGSRRFADAPPPVRAGVSGSGPDLLVLTWSAADLAQERAAGTRVLSALGVRAGMRVANTLSGALTTPGSLLLGDVIEDLGALDIPLGAIDSDAAVRPAWELIDRVQPQIIVLEEQSAARFLNAAPDAPRSWLLGIIFLQRGAARMPPMSVPGASGFHGWQRTWLAIPEARSFVAHTCFQSRFHVDNGVLVEIVDERSSTSVPSGRDGVLVVTPLGGDTPLLRYVSDLRGHQLAESCACGARGFVVELR